MHRLFLLRLDTEAKGYHLISGRNDEITIKKACGRYSIIHIDREDEVEGMAREIGRVQIEDRYAAPVCILLRQRNREKRSG